MKTTVKIQELSDGRFRNAVTGKIGDSVSSVMKDDYFGDIKRKIKHLKMVRKNFDIAIQNLTEATNSNDRVAIQKANLKLIRLKADINRIVDDLVRYQ